jgi:hypothetical protein
MQDIAYFRLYISRGDKQEYPSQSYVFRADGHIFPYPSDFTNGGAGIESGTRLKDKP